MQLSAHKSLLHRTNIPITLMAIAISLSDCTVNAAVLYNNNWDTTNIPFVDTTGHDLSQQPINSLYGQPGFIFQETFTVETLELQGSDAFGTGYSDPSGLGGLHSIAMFSDVQDDNLSLTFDAGSNNFLNLLIAVSSVDTSFAGGSFVPPGAVPTVEFRLYDSPGGVFNINAPGTLLDSAQLVGVASAPDTLVWTQGAIPLNAAISTDGNVSLVIDLLDGGYAALDNIEVSASNTAIPEPSSLTLLLFGGLAVSARRSRKRRSQA